MEGLLIGRSKGRDEGKEWESEHDFGLSLKTANLEDMDRNGWLIGWKNGNGWMDVEETEKFERVLDHFRFSSGEEMELFDEEFLTGDRWWKEEEDEEGKVDVERIPDRVKFFRRRRRAAVMERLGEMTNPLSQEGSIPSEINIGTYFTTMGSFMGRWNGR